MGSATFIVSPLKWPRGQAGPATADGRPAVLGHPPSVALKRFLCPLPFAPLPLPLCSLLLALGYLPCPGTSATPRAQAAPQPASLIGKAAILKPCGRGSARRSIFWI